MKVCVSVIPAPFKERKKHSLFLCVCAKARLTPSACHFIKVTPQEATTP